MNLNPLIESIIKDTNDEKGVLIGESLSYNSRDLLIFFESWTTLLDELIEDEYSSLGYISEGIIELEEVRMFTYHEYLELFNESIAEQDYEHYPVYKTLDIQTKEEKRSIQFHVDKSESGYLKAIQMAIPSDLQHHLEKKFSKNLIRLPLFDKTLHSLIVGTTGAGKSNLLRHIIYEIDKTHEEEATQIILDPHGLLAKDILKTRFSNMVIHFDVLKSEDHTFSFNLFEVLQKDRATISFASENILSVLDQVIKTDFSDVQTNVLQYCIEFLLQRDSSTVKDFLQLLSLKEPIIAEAVKYDSWFKYSFQSGRRGNTREAILDKFEKIVKSSALRDVLLGASTFNLRTMINEKKILLFDLSGLPPELSRPALGKMLLAYIKNILFLRDPSQTNHPVFLFIDEAPVFISETYKTFLEQMRKYQVSTFLVFQHFNQIADETIRNSIKQNTQIKIVRSLYLKDAMKIARPPHEVENGTYRLQEYDFLFDAFNKEPSVLRPSYFLDEAQYQLSEKEQEENKTYLLQNYYKPLTKKEPAPLPETSNKALLPYKQDQFNHDTKKQTVEPPSLTKNNLVLYYLGMFKYLTLEQMIDLGVANSSTNIPTGPLKKAGYIKSVKAKLKEEESFKNVFFLVKKGSKIAADFGLPRVHYPTRIIKSIGDWDHVKYVTEHAIAFYKYGIEWMKKDIDRSTIRNKKATNIPNPDQDFEPDIIFQTNNNLYLFEYESINSSFQKCMEKIELHSFFLSNSIVSDYFDFKKQHLVLMVFHSKPILERLRSACSDFEHKDRILLKHTEDDPINGWGDIDMKKRMVI